MDSSPESDYDQDRHQFPPSPPDAPDKAAYQPPEFPFKPPGQGMSTHVYGFQSPMGYNQTTMDRRYKPIINELGLNKHAFPSMDTREATILPFPSSAPSTLHDRMQDIFASTFLDQNLDQNQNIGGTPHPAQNPYTAYGPHLNASSPTQNPYAAASHPHASSSKSKKSKPKQNPYIAAMKPNAPPMLASHFGIRLPDQNQGLASLDQKYENLIATNLEHQESREQVRDHAIRSNHHLTTPVLTAPEFDKAKAIFDQHIVDRQGHTQMASQRLHAIMGVRNDLPFDLPSTQLPAAPKSYIVQNHASWDDEDEVGSGNGIVNTPAIYVTVSTPGGPGHNHDPSPTYDGSPNGSGGNNPESFAAGPAAVNRPHQEPQVVFPQDFHAYPNSHAGIALQQQMFMNSNTANLPIWSNGKGLREFLLANGKKFGQQKQECSSISFHDFTPNPKTGAHANSLLGHYGTDHSSERVVVYRTDIPFRYIDPNGVAREIKEPWIWFLIVRPLITISPRSTVTHPTFDEPYYDPNIFVSQNTQGPPRNFDNPIPQNFVVFALPAAACTIFGEEKDTATQVHTRNGMDTLPWKTGKLGAPYPARIYKRQDYNLSTRGIPIFEFSSASSPGLVLPTTAAPLSFLSAEAIGPYYNSDTEARKPPLTDEEWTNWCEQWSANNAHSDELISSDLADKGLLRELRLRGLECPGPKHGRWWDVFYAAVYEDAERWRRIRRAMGTGTMRIATRWSVSKDDADMEELRLEREGMKHLRKRLRKEKKAREAAKKEKEDACNQEYESGGAVGDGGLGVQDMGFAKADFLDRPPHERRVSEMKSGVKSGLKTAKDGMEEVAKATAKSRDRAAARERGEPRKRSALRQDDGGLTELNNLHGDIGPASDVGQANGTEKKYALGELNDLGQRAGMNEHDQQQYRDMIIGMSREADFIGP